MPVKKDAIEWVEKDCGQKEGLNDVGIERKKARISDFGRLSVWSRVMERNRETARIALICE